MEDELDPAVQRVLATPELLDTIFSFMDPQTAGRARQVCRKWRSVSDLYLKRRTVMDFMTLDYAYFCMVMTNEVQEENLLNRRIFDEYGPPVELRLSRDPPGCYYHREAPTSTPAPIVAFMLDVNWSRSLRKLFLDQCLTADDWVSFGMMILHKMKNLKAIEVNLSCYTGPPALCFTEVQDQLKNQKLQNGKLKQFEIRMPKHPSPHWLEGKLASIASDVYATCPNLKGFVMHDTGEAESYISIRRINDYVDPRSGMWVWEAEMDASWPPQMDRTLKYPAVRFFVSVLKAVDVVKLKMLVGPEVLSCLESEPSVVDRLKNVCLDGLTESPSMMKCLASTTAFKNVRSLTLSVDLHKEDLHLRLEEFCAENVTFPSLVNLQLYRNKNGDGIESEGGFEIEKWIFKNILTMAPNLQRLIAYVFHRYSNGDVGDYQKVLNFAKSFNQLKHLVLVNGELLTHRRSTRSCLNKNKLVSCLEGLTSITLRARSPELLLEYSRVFLEACKEKPLHSIREMKLYIEPRTRQECETQILELSQLGVEIPKHVNVTTGLWSSWMTNDLLEEGIE